MDEIQELFLELYEKAYKNNKKSGCTTRAQLLSLALKRLEYKPKIIRYFVKDEKDKDSNKRKKLVLLNRQRFPSHVVVQLGNKILDANLDRIIKKQEYDKELYKKTGHKIEYFLYEGVDIELCKQYVEKFNLHKFSILFK